MEQIVWLQTHSFWTQLKIAIFVLLNPDLLISPVRVKLGVDNMLEIFILSSLKWVIFII